MVNGVGELLAIIDTLSESLDLVPKGDTCDRTRSSPLESFLHIRFEVKEDPQVCYPILEARPYMKQGVIRVPVLKNEAPEDKWNRFSEYQKFFYPALTASRLAILKEVHNWFVSSASKEALEKYKQTIKSKMK